MKTRNQGNATWTRREALVGAAGVGAASLVGCGGTNEDPSSISQAATRPRVAVIGGGAGGVASAYFLAGDCDVTIFESRAKIGGHCDSQLVTYQGQQVTVDL